MSSRACKTRSRRTSTDQMSASSGGSGVASPRSPPRAMSPTATTRQQEREQLAQLNDRLAAYIDRVRSLESDNGELVRQIRVSQESVTRQVDNVRELYDKEVQSLRLSLDELAREKAQLQINLGSALSERDRLSARVRECETALEASNKKTSSHETIIKNLQAKVERVMSEKQQANADLQEAKTSRDKISADLTIMTEKCTEESLARVESQNRCTSLQEELEFKTNLYEHQLTETRSRYTVEHVTTVTETNRLRQQHQQQLQESLQQLRTDYEHKMADNREQIEGVYETKLGELNEQLDSRQASLADRVRQCSEQRAEFAAMRSRTDKLEATNHSLLARLQQLEKQLDEERAAAAAQLADREQQLQQLHNASSQQLQEFADLLDVKVALDVELATYRKMLETEEQRLHMSPGANTSSDSRKGGATRGSPSTPTGARCSKSRKRNCTADSAKKEASSI